MCMRPSTARMPIFVGGPVRESLLDAAAGEPHRIACDIVVPAVLSLRGRLAAELAAEQDQRFLEQPPLLQVGQQRGRGLIDRRAAIDQSLVQVVVVVPAGLANLDESHAGLAEPAGHHALAGERPGWAGLHAVGRRAQPAGSREMSSSSGTFPCIRNASSYDSMMPSISLGAPGSAASVTVHRLDQLELPALLSCHDLRPSSSAGIPDR